MNVFAEGESDEGLGGGGGVALVCRKLAAAAAAAATRSEKSALNHRLAVKLFDHIVFFVLTAIFLSFSFFFLVDACLVGGNSCLGTGKSKAVNSPLELFQDKETVTDSFQEREFCFF